ncbi:MAG: LPS-assembly protein LptD [Prevotella sp.]|nr:LPS-assembly protein LptD [Prevotella sp.]MCH3986142.1 LPS-assembly protein LptD [Prevotella sp.]MCH3992966.1 LPS-assembly protein LptD [Prevotella sp.]MCH4018103.1 LPS-assembly protein LptD [Prevotella sp.]MCH4186978.1 LPS-assembly protein LptD [Prevotella sp.]
MRRKSVIFLLLCAFMYMMAVPNMPFFKRKKKSVTADSVALRDSVKRDSSGHIVADTTKMDSLQLAIYHHNKIIDDSIRLDSINRKKAGGIDAPINYQADDSIVYDANRKMAYLYGNSNVKYENYNLTSDRIRMNMDHDLMQAHGTKDSTAEGGVKGKPVFKVGQDEYQTDTIAFNYKSKKALVDQVYTHQDEGYLSGKLSKRDSTGIIYLQHGRYTTCDKQDPDFYIALSRAKVRPGKDVIFGPAYLVVADVPLPFAIPYGFFPFTKHYSSGFIMPSYGDENARGFYLRNGGYYFAVNDDWDLKLLGEIYTEGSWGLSAATNYRKRYRYSGSFYLSYQNTKTGDKGMPDYAKQESFKIQWSHRQDAKANPFSSLSASVNFATSSYEKNNLTSLYNPQSYTQSTRTSSVSWSTGFSSIGLSLSATANLSQNMRDSSLAMTLPDLSISLARFYPFRRKHLVGKERWYEKIAMSYTGQISNSINTTEDRFLHSNLIKDWKNGWEHTIPISASFTLFNAININPSFNFTDRMYTNKIMRSWDEARQTEVCDTTYGLHNIYNWNFSVGASTKVYGFWVPNKKIFGDKIQAIRHVFTPTVTFSYSPDFGARRYGYWDSYQKTDADGNVSLVSYSPYSDGLYSVPGKGRSENVTWDIDNNLEMKVKSDKDSTGFKKISLIDELGATMSYNAAASYHRWSDLSVRMRLKWWKNYTFNFNGMFSTYAYELDQNGDPYVSNHTEFGKGRFPRFQGMSQNISYTLTPDKIKKFFHHGDEDQESKNKNKKNNPQGDDEGTDTNIESNIDPDMEKGKNGAQKSGKAETDENGYMKFSMPWSLTFGYGISMRENTSGKFNYKHMRYPYKYTQTLNVSGNIRISDGWNINFSSGYDFEYHKISMTTASLQRDLHCFNMSCDVVLAPYTSYNFVFRCNASTLTDALKYEKRSGYSNAVQWY